MTEDEIFMRRCIELARRAEVSHDTLVGALIVFDGRIIAEGTEAVKAKSDITAHAEIEVIKAACVSLKSVNLTGCILYSTAEPCFMCAYAIRQARISEVVFGRPAPGVGGVTSSHPILTDASIANWTPPPEIVTRILQEECEELMRKPPAKMRRV